MQQIYLGADVSKGYADFCFLGDNGSRLPVGKRWDDTPAGHAHVRAALEQLRTAHPDLQITVGVEASGGLERNWLHLFRRLAGPEDQVFQLNPLVVKRFRERHLHQNVTDQTSAADLADYLREGRRRADRPYEPELQGARTLHSALHNQIKRSAGIQNELHNLLPVVQPELVQYCRHGFPAWVLAVLRRYPLASQLARARVTTLMALPYVTAKRAETLVAAAKESVASLTDAETALVIQDLVREFQRLEATIARGKQVLEQRLKDDPEVRRMLSIPGIGPATAGCLRLEAGSLTRFHTANALVAFAGLDPLNHQSGDTERRGGISHRGNSALRAALHMAVLTGIRCNPVLQAFYQRLRSQGKAHLTATTACMAKLLRIAYACVLKDEDFDPERQEATRQKHQQAAETRQAKAAATTAAPACLTAPITRREAKKRKLAAGAPQADRSPQERGHAAAEANHSTEPTLRPTETAATPSRRATLLSNAR
jgi:transposase